MTTKSQVSAADVTALMRARNPLLWIVTREEGRTERYLIEAAAAASYVPRCWDVAQGVTGIDGRAQSLGSKDPGEMLAYISDRAQNDGAGAERGCWIMRDLPAWLDGTIGLTTLRALRNLARTLPGIGRSSAQVVVIISPSAKVPPELADHATVIDWPMPDREEIAGIFSTLRLVRSRRPTRTAHRSAPPPRPTARATRPSTRRWDCLGTRRPPAMRNRSCN